MNNLVYNLPKYIKFIFKKDKVKLIVWTLALVLYGVGFVPIFQGILDTSTSSQVIVDTMKNPAMIAMVGPVFVEDAYTIGSIYANYMLVFSAIIAATMNIFIIANNTKKDEEYGASELLLSLPLGRYSILAGNLIIAFILNLIILLATAFGMVAISAEIGLKGAFIFSSAIYGFGFLFACITALFSQIFTRYRSVLTYSFLTLFVFYLIRAIGDVSLELLSYISPLGLITRTENFVNDYTWPLVLLLVEILLVLGITFVLAKNRDLGSGLVAEKSGKTKASPLLRGVKTFAFKLSRNSIIIWSLVIFVFSAMYGSVFGDLENYITTSELLRNMFTIDGPNSITEQFIALLMVIMSMISTIPSLTILHRILSEEKKGYSEQILTKEVSRFHYLISFFIISILASVLFQVLVALGFWSVGSIYLESIPSLTTFLISALIYLPAIWLMVGISILLIGFAPKFAWINYLFLGYNFMIVYMGRLLDFPQILEDLTPFGNVVQYPLEALTWTSSLVMLGLFVVFSVVGFIGYRKRDLRNG